MGGDATKVPKQIQTSDRVFVLQAMEITNIARVTDIIWDIEDYLFECNTWQMTYKTLIKYFVSVIFVSAWKKLSLFAKKENKRLIQHW